MTTRELLEMATLDAQGFLDASEQKAFERAFRSTSPSVQRQIVREQRRLAADESMLPSVEIPVGLRERVLAAVRDAMTAVRADAPSDVLARLLPNSISMRRNVTPLWRAACIAFASATIILLLAGFSLQQEIQRAITASRDANLASIISQEMGPEFASALLDPGAQRIAFHKAPGSERGSAAVLFDPEAQIAFLVCNDLKVFEGQYSLAIINEAGEIQETIATFAYKGGMLGRPMMIAQHLTSGTQLAILAPQTNELLLVSSLV